VGLLHENIAIAKTADAKNRFVRFIINKFMQK